MTSIETLQARYGPELADLIISKACLNLMEDTACNTVNEAHEKFPNEPLQIQRALRDIAREATKRFADVSG